MPYVEVIWDEEPGGDVEHIAEHGTTIDDVEEVLFNRSSPESVVEFRMPHGVWTVALLPGSAWNVHGVFVAYQSSTKGRMSVLCSLPPQDDVNTGKDCSHVFVGESTHKFRQYGFVDRDNQ